MAESLESAKKLDWRRSLILGVAPPVRGRFLCMPRLDDVVAWTGAVTLHLRFPELPQGQPGTSELPNPSQPLPEQASRLVLSIPALRIAHRGASSSHPVYRREEPSPVPISPCLPFERSVHPFRASRRDSLDQSSRFVTMLRNQASRAVLRSLNAANAQHLRTSFNAASSKAPLTSRLCTLSSSKRPQNVATAMWKPISAVLSQRQRYASTQWDKPDIKMEKEIAEKKLKPEPELVSSTSSIHPMFSEIGTPEPEKETDMMKGIKQDMVCICNTRDPQPHGSPGYLTPNRNRRLTRTRKRSKTPSPSRRCRDKLMYLASRVSFPTSQPHSRPSHAPGR